MLFSFAMYKSAPGDINEFINEHFPKQEDFSYEELCQLVTLKNHSSKERDIEDTWQLLSSNKTSCNSDELNKALLNAGIETNEKELLEIIEFANSNSESQCHNCESFNKEEYKKFISS